MKSYVQYLQALLPFGSLSTVQTHQNVLSASTGSSWDMGSGFVLTNSSAGVDIYHGRQSIWSAAFPFLSASAGDDKINSSNGAFNFTLVDIDTCQGQSVTSIAYVPWEYTTTGSAVQLTGDLLDCGGGGGKNAPYSATFWVPDNLMDRVAFHMNVIAPSPLSSPLTKLYLRFTSHAAEDFYGLGAQASFASLKGHSVPIFSREQGVGRGDHDVTKFVKENGPPFAAGNHFTTYTAIPSYISTDSNLFYLSETSTAFAIFNFTRSDVVTLRYHSPSVSGMFARSDSMFDAVEKLTAYTGRMPILPDWVDHGAILGIQGGQHKVKKIVEEGFHYGCPITAVWLQDWSGTFPQSNPGNPAYNISRLWWNWENDECLYPDWNDFVRHLRATYNVRTLSYINTFLTNVTCNNATDHNVTCNNAIDSNVIDNNVTCKKDGYRRNLYDEAAGLHYFVQNTTSNSTFIITSGQGLEAGIIDLTNPGLRSWFKEVLRKQVWNAEISGFMCDFGEYTPVTPNTGLDQRSDPFFFHNYYPFLWAQFQREVINDLNLQNEAVVFHRSAAMGSNKYMNLVWGGDQNTNWEVNDGIKSVVTILGHMGLSGYGQSHTELGGYTNIATVKSLNVNRSAELLGRWGELAAVSSSVFRSHEGSIPEVNAQFYTNCLTYTYYSHNARMFVSLARYRRKILEQESATKGWPLLRPPVMYHPDDMKARQISYQSFYLGRCLYVAPVLDPHTFHLPVYFPGPSSGRIYTHVWTGQRYGGGQNRTVPTPYGQPAVFFVEGCEAPELQPFFDFVSREKGTTIVVE